jgi:hypothetical protein
MIRAQRGAIVVGSAVLAACGLGLLAGCGGGDGGTTDGSVVTGANSPTPATPAGGAGPGATMFQVDALAGVPVPQVADPTKLQTLVASRSFSQRNDPFALFPPEVQFDRMQRAESLLQSTGGWTLQYEPPAEVVEEEQLEPQPYRRLAGVLIGDTVAAIIIMEDGRAHIVKPGTKIPDSEWTVVSIDGERAVLRRPGSKRPNQITVRLESPPSGMGGGGGGGTQPGRGNAPQGSSRGGGGMVGPSSGGGGAPTGGIG